MHFERFLELKYSHLCPKLKKLFILRFCKDDWRINEGWFDVIAGFACYVSICYLDPFLFLFTSLSIYKTLFSVLEICSILLSAIKSVAYSRFRIFFSVDWTWSAHFFVMNWESFDSFRLSAEDNISEEILPPNHSLNRYWISTIDDLTSPKSQPMSC